MYTKEQIEAAVKAKGYAWFENGDFDVNIVGIRNSATGKAVTNVFDDWMTISYKENGAWKSYVWACTTDPGTKAVKEFHNPNGVGRLVPNQYRGVWKIDLHQGKYEAVTQQKPVTVFRDKDLDDLAEETAVTETGIFGINIHKAGADSTYVENWSEGCTVFKKSADFEEFMKNSSNSPIG